MSGSHHKAPGFAGGYLLPPPPPGRPRALLPGKPDRTFLVGGEAQGHHRRRGEAQEVLVELRTLPRSGRGVPPSNAKAAAGTKNQFWRNKSSWNVCSWRQAAT